MKANMMEAMLDTSTNNLRIFNACCSLYCAICIDIEMNFFVFYFLLSSHDVHNKEPNDQWPFCHALVGLSDWGCASKIAFHSSVPFFFFFFRVISIHFSVSFECKCKCVEVHFTVGIHETKKKNWQKKSTTTNTIYSCVYSSCFGPERSSFVCCWTFWNKKYETTWRIC